MKFDMEKWILLLFCILMGVLLLSHGAAAAAGASSGLSVCAAIIIPSIFPFLVISGIVGELKGFAEHGALGWICEKIYGLPRAAAPAVLMSLIGGYPAGAQTISRIFKSGGISQNAARSALCFCVNGGPAFMLLVVGKGIFGSSEVGGGIFLSQIAAGLICAQLIRILPKAKERIGTLRNNIDTQRSAAEILVGAVTGAGQSTVSISAFVILISALFSALDAAGAVNSAVLGLRTVTGGALSEQSARCLTALLSEITLGCGMASELTASEAAEILPFALSFGGISVICQIMCCASEIKPSLSAMFASRLLHAALTALICLQWLPEKAAAVNTFSASPVLYADKSTVFITFFMLMLCSMLFLSLEETT